MEHPTGFEPAPPAWKAGMLAVRNTTGALFYADRTILATPPGIAPGLALSKSTVPSVTLRGLFYFLAAPGGVEPPSPDRQSGILSAGPRGRVSFWW